MRLFLLTFTLLAGSLSASAQERSAINPVQNDTPLQSTYASTLQNNLGTLNTQLQTSCTAGDGSHHAAGTSWNENCQDGTPGITRTCLMGNIALLKNQCFTGQSCVDGNGTSHASGSTWAGAANSCPAGTNGNLVYRCEDGITYIDSSSDCAIRNCNGSTYTAACPNPTVDGINLSGNMTFTCQYDKTSKTQSMLLSANTCQTYNKPCGNIASGSSAVLNCGDYGGTTAGVPNYTGQLTLACTNGATSISNWACYLKTWRTFTVTIPGNCTTPGTSSGHAPGIDSYGNEIDQSCSVSVANLINQIHTQLNLDPSVPLQNMDIAYTDSVNSAQDHNIPAGDTCNTTQCLNSPVAQTTTCSVTVCQADIGAGNASTCTDHKTYMSQSSYKSVLSLGKNYTLNITATRNGGCGGVGPGPDSMSISGIKVSGQAFY